jgi:NAD-specific glutamate dehydrogenase
MMPRPIYGMVCSDLDSAIVLDGGMAYSLSHLVAPLLPDVSSKPWAGINHKEYGVTREGAIDPNKDSFTIKMMGSPNGDVRGDEFKILFREYGDNIKVVGIADHSGCAKDTAGIMAHDELLRLFQSRREFH